MNEILTKTIEEMADMEFDCGCGKKHRIDIKHIYVGENVYNRILDVAKEFYQKKSYWSVIIILIKHLASV